MAATFAASALYRGASHRGLCAALLAQLGTATLALGTSALAARTLTPERQGAWSALQTSFWLTLLICGAGTPTSFAVAVAGEAQRPSRQHLQAARTLAVTLGSVAGAVLLFVWGKDALVWAAAAPATLLFQLLLGGLVGGSHLRLQRQLQLLVAAATAGACATGFCLRRADVVWWAPALGQVLGAGVVAFWWSKRAEVAARPHERTQGRTQMPTTPTTPRLRPTTARLLTAESQPFAPYLLLRRGLPTCSGGVLQTLSLRGDLLALAPLVAWQEVAALALAKQICERVGLVGQALAPLALAQTSTRSHKQWLVTSADAQLLCRSAAVSIACAGVLALALPWIVPFLYGSAYGASVSIGWLLLPGAAVQSIVCVWAQQVTGRGRAHATLVAYGLGLAAQGATFCACVPRSGVLGAALANTVGNGVSLVFAIWDDYGRRGSSSHHGG